MFGQCGCVFAPCARLECSILCQGSSLGLSELGEVIMQLQQEACDASKACSSLDKHFFRLASLCERCAAQCLPLLHDGGCMSLATLDSPACCTHLKSWCHRK